MNTGTALLRRGTSTDTGVGLSGYAWQVSTGAAFTSIYLSGSTANTGINIFTMPDNIYYRRAQGVDLNGNTGIWSSGWIFTVDTTLPTITFTGATPANNAIVGTVFTGQLDFTELNLGQFIRNRSGASYPLYDSGLVVMYNFDNVAALGESGSIVGDMSLYDNTGTVYG